MWAFDNGRSRVGVLVGGWAAWQDAGYPVEDEARLGDQASALPRGRRP